MRRTSLWCLKSLGACSALWVAGCGTHQPPAALDSGSIPTPRRIELPPNIRPLYQANLDEQEQPHTGNVPAQYEQPPAPAGNGPQLAAPNSGRAAASSSPAWLTTPAADSPRPVPQTSPAQPPMPVRAGTSGEMQIVAQQAMQLADRAALMAQKGMLFSARSELIKAMTVLTQALDVQQGVTTYSLALQAGLTALHEARDFASAATQSGGTTSVESIGGNHITRLPTALAPGGSPLVAQQQYFAYAQSELTVAANGLPAASQVLYRLGRLHTAMAAHDADPAALHGPQAIVFHQAALATDGTNWLAANELGVLYAKYGQLPAAKQLLLQSVLIRPHREGWHNLAAIHRQLGENDLAQRAETERQLVEQQPGSAANGNETIRWVDPKAFAAAGGGDTQWPASVAAKPGTAPAAVRR